MMIKRHFGGILILFLMLAMPLRAMAVYTDYGISTPVYGENTWDAVYIGSYPQAEVVQSVEDMKACIDVSFLKTRDYIVDPDLYARLTQASWDWSQNTVIDGERYHRLLMRDATYAVADSNNYYHWVDGDIYHYFKYQPILWRVLDISEDGIATVMSDLILDDQRFNAFYDPVNWSTSSIRNWLNGSFYNTAFSEAEKAAIQTVEVNNTNEFEYIEGVDSGPNTIDHLYLLAESEAYNTDYGFADGDEYWNVPLRCMSSTYAKAMGTYISNTGTAFWWLRTAGVYDYDAAYVDYEGDVFRFGDYDHDYSHGVRPVMNIDLASSQYTYAGPVQGYTEPFKKLPGVAKLTAESRTDGVNLTWKPVEGAEGYLIYGFHGSPKTGATYSYIGMRSASSTAFLDKNALSSDWNYYYVFPYSKDASGKMHPGANRGYVFGKKLVETVLPAVSNVKAASQTGGVKLSWSATEDADGYLIYGFHGSPNNGATYGYIGMTSQTSFLDKKALKSDYNFYYVFAYYRNQNNKIIAGHAGKYVYGKAR